MTKELTHRAGELKNLGWAQEDVLRYVELWEYRQRWGAINLEREDRQFLRKAEALLPQISKTKSSVKKLIKEKSYYRWLSFFLEEMNEAEAKLKLLEGSKGLWPILLEEELRALDYYEPVLGLPDTLKAKLLKPIREEIIERSSIRYKSDLQMFEFNFNAPLKALEDKSTKSWKPLRSDELVKDMSYPIINSKSIDEFRKEVREVLLPAIKDNFPSLAGVDKPAPPEEWSSKAISLAKKEDS